MNNVTGLDKRGLNPGNAFDPRAIEQFIYREARLADENRYDEWIALWTDDAIYWLPANIDDYDPRHHLSIIYDDRDRLQDRIDRILRQALIGFPGFVFVLWLSLREEAKGENSGEKNWKNANSHNDTVRGAVATWSAMHQLATARRTVPIND